MRTLLLASPKILLQNSLRDWGVATGGDAVLFTDSAGQENLRRHLGDAFAQIEFFDQFNTNGLVEKRATECHRTRPFEAIVPLAESDILRSARLRERLEIEGMRPEEAKLFRNKYEMKRHAKKFGVNVANFRIFKDSLDILEFVEDYGLPVVVKPVDGRGSAGVEVIANEAELDAYLQSPAFARRESTLIETFVPGEMYQANGMFVDGKCVLVSIVKCVNSNLQFLNGTYLGLAMLDETSPLRRRLVAFAQHLLEDVFPMPRRGLFHIEIFHTPSDDIFLCELACRLAGCIANDQIREAYGIDVRLEFIKSQCHHGYSWPDSATRYSKPLNLIAELNIPPTPGVLISIPHRPPFDWIRFQSLSGVPGRRYSRMSLTNGEIASYLISGDTLFTLTDRIHHTAQWFSDQCVWQK